MKKSFFVLPFVAAALAACTNNSPSDQVGAEVTSVGMPDWQSTDVQQVAMPSSMGQPVYQPAPQAFPPQPMPQPIYNAPQPTYQHEPSAMETVGGCQVVRDMNNAPIYAQIKKGCYTGSTYTVGKGDTVFLVAYLAGKSVGEIAQLNHLVQPYQLKTGQQLRLK